MKDWNVVVTVQESRFKDAVPLLWKYGRVEKTSYFNVVTMQVEDTAAFLEAFRQGVEQDPDALLSIGRIVPCTHGFLFQSVEDFETKAQDAARAFLGYWADHCFCVRMHRRGFQRTMSSQEEAANLGEFLKRELLRRGTPARVTFEDPDMILAVEAIGQRAGMSLWSREQRARYPFLKLD